MFPKIFEEANKLYNRNANMIKKLNEIKFNMDVSKCKKQILKNCKYAMKENDKSYTFQPYFLWFGYYGDLLKEFDYEIVDYTMENIQNDYPYIKYDKFHIDGDQNKLIKYEVYGWSDEFKQF